MYSVSKHPRGEKRFFHNRALAGAMSRSVYQIPNSLLFRGSQYLSRTQSVASSAQNTFEFWYRRSSLGAIDPIFNVPFTSGTREFELAFDADNKLWIYDQVGSSYSQRTSTAVFRDTTAWLHVVVWIDPANATAANRMRAWVNGDEITAWDSSVSSLTTTCLADTGVTHSIGASNGGTHYAKGTLARFTHVDGALVAHTAFGETDVVTGNWRPKAPIVPAWGTNGCYLGKLWNAASLGIDYSGQGNSWTPNGFAASDVLSDSPTNVYATLNPLVLPRYNNERYTLSNGNLSAVSGTYPTAVATLCVSAGKWYWETKVDALSGAGLWIGVFTQSDITAGFPSAIGNTASSVSYTPAGTKISNGSEVAFGSSWTVGDVVGVALDCDNGKVWFSKNGVWQASGNPATGASPAFTFVGGHLAVPGWTDPGNSVTGSFTANFGQRPFAYTPPPAGFKALCSANLLATIGATSGSFTGNASADGPCIYTGAVPATLTINGNAVTWGTHADKLATGFKLRTSSTSYNASSTNNWVATYSTPAKPTVGSNKVPANAQGNP